MTVGPDGVSDVGPPDAVVSLAPAMLGDNVRLTSCGQLNFFASRAAAAGWLADHPGGAALPVAGAFQLSRRIARLLTEG